jgi:hypothetical protein
MKASIDLANGLWQTNAAVLIWHNLNPVTANPFFD